MTLRLGVEVGHTHTDAVIIDESGTVHSAAKVPLQSLDDDSSVAAAIEAVCASVDRSEVMQAMLGSAIVERALTSRSELSRVGVLRLSAPAAVDIPPGAGWPRSLRDRVIGPARVVAGGHEFDGSEISPLDERAVIEFARSLSPDIDVVAISAPYSLASPFHETRAAAQLAEIRGPGLITVLSHQLGSLGLLERENTSILNASLLRVVQSEILRFTTALKAAGLDAKIFLTQNDGTLSSTEQATQFPLLTLGSRATSSMRGAGSLSGVPTGIVVDVGVNQTTLGTLVDGFPRESTVDGRIEGVRTNFRMPELISLPFGGDRMKGGAMNPAITRSLELACARLRTVDPSLPVIAVGEASSSLDRYLPKEQLVVPPHAELANAYGAAIADVSGSVDLMFRYQDRPRDECLAEARTQAVTRAIEAGADPDDVRVSSMTELPLTYIPGEAARVTVRAVGRLLPPADPRVPSPGGPAADLTR